MVVLLSGLLDATSPYRISPLALFADFCSGHTRGERYELIAQIPVSNPGLALRTFITCSGRCGAWEGVKLPKAC